MIPLLLAGLGLAAPALEPVGTLGYEAAWNDVFVARRGLRAGIGLGVGPWLSTELSGAVYPVLGRADLTALTRGLIDDLHISPDISRILWAGRAGVHLWPLHDESARLGLGGGVAAFRTRDDLDSLHVGVADEVPHVDQVHPGWFVDLRAEAWRGPVGLRVRLERSHFVEQVMDNDERKTHYWVGVEGAIRPRP